MSGYRGDRRLTRGCRKGLISVGSRVIPYKKSVLNMVEVECPLCTSTVDLGSNATGTYECPYCHEDFEWTGWDELEGLEDFAWAEISELRATKLLQSVENQNAGKKYKFPMLVGNQKARWPVPTIGEVLVMICFIPLLPLYLVIGPIILIFSLFINQIKRVKYRREFKEDILNPEYLRGTGLVVFSDLSAELVTKRRVPRYMFEREDLTSIVLHEESYSIGSSEYELKICLHGFHALTLYGFNKNDSEIIVNKLTSLYDINFRYTHHYNEPDSGGGGGGGG